MGIPFTFEDGSTARLEPGEYGAFMQAYHEVFGRPPVLPTQAEVVRAVMAERRAEAVEVEATKNDAVTGLRVVPSARAKRVVIPVTESENVVIERLMEHPEGVRTRLLAIEIGWPHSKASRMVTQMARQGRAVERIPGRKEYRLTKEALTAKFEVVYHPNLYVEE